MFSEIPNYKITLMKRTLDQDLIDKYADDQYKDQIKPYEIFQDTQEFILEGGSVYSQSPTNFCVWAVYPPNVITIMQIILGNEN